MSLIGQGVRLSVFASGVLLLLASCTDSTTASSRTDLEGVYTLSLTRARAICSPLALPDAIVADTSQYASIPTVQSASIAKIRVQLDGTKITIAPLGAQGQIMTSFSATGTIDSNGRSETMRIGTPRLESLRQGGHTFYVTESELTSTYFMKLPQLPPGNGVDVQESSAGTQTFTFRDGGATGAIFTTCAISFSSSGARE